MESQERLRKQQRGSLSLHDILSLNTPTRLVFYTKSWISVFIEVISFFPNREYLALLSLEWWMKGRDHMQWTSHQRKGPINYILFILALLIYKFFIYLFTNLTFYPQKETPPWVHRPLILTIRRPTPPATPLKLIPSILDSKNTCWNPLGLPFPSIMTRAFI